MTIYILTEWYEHEDAGTLVHETNSFEAYIDAYNVACDRIAGDSYYDYLITKEVVNSSALNHNDEKMLSYYSRSTKQWFHGDDIYNVPNFMDGSVMSDYNYCERNVLEFWKYKKPYITNNSPLYLIWRTIDMHNNEIIEDAANEIEGYKEFCSYTLFSYIIDNICIYEDLFRVHVDNIEVRTYINSRISQLTVDLNALAAHRLDVNR